MGLGYKEVGLTEYQSKWIELFQQESSLIRKTIYSDIISIEHVGSTAVVGMESKPIVDILIGLKCFDSGYNEISNLKEIGYVYKGHIGKSKRFYFYKIKDQVEIFHIHLVEYGDCNWKNLISFRDRLREDSTLAENYLDLKKHLARKYPQNRAMYTNMKSVFIKEVLSE